MPAPRLEQTAIRTRLARWRVLRELTQQEMWEATGIARTTYIRMEQGREPNPRVRHLQNCAIVLGVALEDLIEDEWRRWLILDDRTLGPPDEATPPSSAT